MSKNRYLLLGLIIGIYLVNGVFYLRAQSITSDEGSFMNYAVRLLKGHPERIHPNVDNSKMPVSVLNLIPRITEQILHPGLQKNDYGNDDIFSGRYITLIISVFTIILVFKWSSELFGHRAGLFSAFLISFCPNMIANAGLVTTDSYSMLFLLMTMYCLWKCCHNKSRKYFILFSICLGLSQLVKQSLFHLYIIFPLAISVYYIVNRLPFRWKPFVMNTIIVLFGSWLIINAGFYFRDTNKAIGNFHFMSRVFLGLQQMLPSWVPIPLPEAFVSGLDMAKFYDQVGGGEYNLSSFGKVTIMGRSSTGGGFWYYYLVSLFFKTPISSVIYIVCGIIMMIRKRPVRSIMNNEFFLLLPVVYFLLYMSFLYNTQCGIRQIIFIYPFLYILCGGIMPYLHRSYKLSVVLLPGIFLVVSVSGYWTNYYPYTNELIMDKKMAYSYVGAGNLEFKQGHFFFNKYLKEHPDVRLADTLPRTGVFLINTADFLDIWNLHKYDWLSHIRPSGHVAYNGLLITVTEKDLDDHLQTDPKR